MNQQRIAFLDYLRIFACFLVMVVHASENFYGAEGSSEIAGPQSFLACEADRLWVSVYDGFSRMCVPLFIMVSAYLLTPMKAGMTAKEFYRRRAKRLLPPFFIFAILYSTLPLLWGQLDADTALNDLWHIPFNFPSLAGHLWFMFTLFGLYLFIPIISPWLDKATEREERFFIILFLVSTCIPYLNRWVGEVWGQCFWNPYHSLWYFSGFMGYVVMGHYVRTKLQWSTARRMGIGASLLAVGAAATILSFYVQATPGVIHSTTEIELGWTSCTINCALATFGTFIMFTCIKRPCAFVADISQRSYGMYLMHIFWLGLWVWVFKGQLQCPSVAAIPAMAVCTFVSSYITTKIISLIPGGKWVMG